MGEIKVLVSVVIPIYNVENYLHSCLASVQNQIYQRFEAILVNDCTPDNSMSIAKVFAEKDERFRIIHHEANKDLGGARNTGIENAKGEYIFFLDSDDTIPIDALFLLVNNAVEENSDQVLGDMFWSYGNVLSPVEYIHDRIHEWGKFPADQNLRGLPPENYMTGSAANRLYRTDLLHNADVRFLEKTKFEDIPFSLEIWFRSKRISYIQDCIYFRTRRDDPDNRSKTQFYDERSFLDRDKIVEEILKFSKTHAAKDNDLVDLAKITLIRILGTSKNITEYAELDIKRRIEKKWLFSHEKRIKEAIENLDKNFLE